jgi:hypothetical protein
VKIKFALTQFSFLFLGTALGSAAFAMGKTKTPDPATSQVVKIIFYEKSVGAPQTMPPIQETSRPDLHYCSGSVISPNRILTDAHCDALFDSKDQHLAAAVYRYGASMGYEVKRHVRHPNYQVIDRTQMHIHDVAIFEVDAELSSTIRLPRSAEEIRELLRTPERCHMYGYGRDAAGRVGNYHALPIQLLSHDELYTRYKEAALGAFFYSGPSHTRPGDSGGPTLCQDDDGTLVQIATNSWMSVDSPFSGQELLNMNLDWITETLALPELPEPSQAN